MDSGTPSNVINAALHLKVFQPLMGGRFHADMVVVHAGLGNRKDPTVLKWVEEAVRCRLTNPKAAIYVTEWPFPGAPPAESTKL